MCNICIAGFHEVKAEEARWAHNPKDGMWNSRSKPSLAKRSDYISF